MPTNWNPEREREYDELKEEFEDEGRYPGREEEVAARIVNKQRREFGETEAAQKADQQGRSPDRKLPIHDYDQMTADEISSKLQGLSHAELSTVKAYEESHKGRSTVLAEIDRHL